MMRTTSIFTLAVAWLALAVLGHAQMSTFPAPPSLEPAPDDSAKPPANRSTESSDNDSIAATEKKVLEFAESSSTNSVANPSTPTVSAATITSMAALDDKVALEAGDTVSFRVIEDRDDAVSRVVTDTGDVEFPLIGPVKVEGKTCHQVALDVKKLLEVDYYKQATVIIGLDLIVGQEDKTKPKDFAWVVGEVRDVGPLELSKKESITLSQAIVRAGGFGEFANQSKVKLIHRGVIPPGSSGSAPASISNIRDFQVVDVKAVYDGKSNVDPVIKPGDYIIVPKNFINL